MFQNNTKKKTYDLLYKGIRTLLITSVFVLITSILFIQQRIVSNDFIYWTVCIAICFLLIDKTNIIHSNKRLRLQLLYFSSSYFFTSIPLLFFLNIISGTQKEVLIFLQLSCFISGFLFFYLKKNFYEKAPEINKQPHKYFVFLTLTFLILWGAALRLFKIHIPSLWIDEVTSSTAIHGIIKTGLPIFTSGYSYTRDLLVNYYFAAYKSIFNLDFTALRAGSAFFGILLIPLTYLFSKKIYNRSIGLISAFLMAFLTIEITWSRQIRFYIILEFFALLTIYLYFIFEKELLNKKKMIVLLGSVITTLFSSFQGIFILIPIGLHALTRLDFIKEIIYFIQKNKLLIIGFTFLFCIFLYTGTVWVAFQGILASLLNQTNNIEAYSRLAYKYLPSFTALFLFSSLITIPIQNKNHKILNLSLILFSAVAFFLWGSAYIRFFLIFAPFIILNVSHFIFYTIRNQPLFLKTITSILLIIFLTKDGSITLLPKENYPMQEPRANFSLAYDCVYNRLTDDDFVISITTGAIPAHFYLKEKFLDDKNYVLSFIIRSHMESYKAYYDSNMVLKEGYFNIPIIASEIEFKDILKESHGYIVFDQQKIHHFREQILQEIAPVVQIIPECSDQSIKTYVWNTSSQ